MSALVDRAKFDTGPRLKKKNQFLKRDSSQVSSIYIGLHVFVLCLTLGINRYIVGVVK